VDAADRNHVDLPRRFFRRLDDVDSSCAEFRIDGDTLSSETIRWGLSVEGRDLLLTGPTIRGVRARYTPALVLEPDPSGEVSFLCAAQMFVARRTERGWELVRRSVGVTGIWAYSPASSVQWFASRAACERESRGGRLAAIASHGCG
jgi:hypothetical protein